MYEKNKISEFYMIFARKMSEFYMKIAKKYFPIFFWGGRARAPPLPSVSYASEIDGPIPWQPQTVDHDGYSNENVKN